MAAVYTELMNGGSWDRTLQSGAARMVAVAPDDAVFLVNWANTAVLQYLPAQEPQFRE